MWLGGPGGAVGSDTAGQSASMKETYAAIEKNVN